MLTEMDSIRSNVLNANTYLALKSHCTVLNGDSTMQLYHTCKSKLANYLTISFYIHKENRYIE